MSSNGLVVVLAQGAPQIDGHINGPKLHSFVFVVDYRPCCKSPLQLFFTTSATPPLKMPSLIVCPLLHLFLPEAPLKMTSLIVCPLLHLFLPEAPLKMTSLIVCPLLHLFLPEAPLKMYSLSLYILYFTTFFLQEDDFSQFLETF